MNDKIRQLQKEIEVEKIKIEKCDHNYGKSFYNPYKINEGYGCVTKGQGSDIWSDFEGYREVEKPRWTRVCTKCGNEDHTCKQKPIVSGFEPDFK